MRLYIFSTQPEINAIFHDHFTSKGFLCIVFSSLEDFLTSIDRSSAPPDLMILDYVIFNHDIFNIYAYLEKRKTNCPCIFYNDPCLTRKSRKSHWKSQINIIQNKDRAINVDRLDPVFDDLQALVENETLSQSIKLMAMPKPFPKELVNPKITLEYIRQQQDCGTEDFRKRSNLPDSLFYLLKILQRNKDLRMTIKDIQKCYEEDKKQISERSLYVMLSKLRGIIRDDKQAKFIIRKDGEYYRFIKFISE